MIVTAKPLNISMLMDLIHWAEVSERFRIEREMTAPTDIVEEGAPVELPGLTSRWGVWDQNSWAQLFTRREVRGDTAARKARNGVCGSAYCMAGQTVNQSGYRLILDSDYKSTDFSASQCIAERPTGRYDNKGGMIYEDVPGAPILSISEAARDILGLNEREADRFFEGDNNIEILKEMVNAFCVRRELPLAYPAADVYDTDRLDDSPLNW